MRRSNELVEILLSESELKKYNVIVESLALHKSFPTKMIDDLQEIAKKNMILSLI